jgi:hypothetical protein
MRRILVTVMAIATAAAMTLQGTASARQVRPNRAQAGTHAVVRLPHRGLGESILFYAPTVGKRHVTEASIAEAMGFDVTIAKKGQWAAMSTADFQAFGAIVFADPGCKSSTDRLDVADATAATWSAAIQGNAVVTGTDPVWHLNRGVAPAPEMLIANTLSYVSQGDGTGLAVSLSCYYSQARRNTPVSLLRSIGSFAVRGQNHIGSGCPDRVETPDPAHALLTGLTAADLSDWRCSIHEAFDAMPSGFDVVAQHKKTGLAYIIAGVVGAGYP